MDYFAVEKASEVRKAVNLFQSKVEKGCSFIDGFSRGRTCWNAHLGFWSHFEKWKRADGSDRYWNVFGFQTDNLRRRLIVEINPPVLNKYKSMQGVIAQSNDGLPWLLHRGQLSTPGKHISEDDFDARTRLTRVIVTFSDERQVSCYPIAMLDDDANIIQTKLLRYINECRKIRHWYMFGQKVADYEEKTSGAEEEPTINPELTSGFLIPAQDAKLIERKHGQVWKALAAKIKKLHLSHTNERIGRWGPDLVIIDKNVLFEIKISTDASDIQKGLGQLLLYEALIGKTLKKVLVLPGPINKNIHDILVSMQIKFLLFREENRKIIFNEKDIGILLN